MNTISNTVQIYFQAISADTGMRCPPFAATIEEAKDVFKALQENDPDKKWYVLFLSTVQEMVNGLDGSFHSHISTHPLLNSDSFIDLDFSYLDKRQQSLHMSANLG